MPTARLTTPSLNATVGEATTPTVTRIAIGAANRLDGLVDVNINGVTDGQSLFYNSSLSIWQANSIPIDSLLSSGQAINITTTNGVSTVSAFEASAVVTANGGIGVYGANSDNDTSTGVATFASEQFNVDSGHVFLTTLDGGSY